MGPLSDWGELFQDHFKKEYFREMMNFLDAEEGRGKKIYPEITQVFRAFELTSFANTKVVILGQDPYHQPGQAHGLSFSVPEDIKPPPSLRNIFKELQAELEINWSGSGDLTKWAEQGVLLLNTVLTVEEGKPGSHTGIGWENLTNDVIKKINEEASHPIIFLIWGAKARAKLPLIDQKAHIVLKAPHPSPYSAHNGFFGCGHFKQTNEHLIRWGLEPIDWEV